MNKFVQQINEYKEVYIFLLILIIWLICIIIFRLDIILGLQNIITTSAIIVALGAALLSIIYNKEAIKQSEINLNKQLIYEDRKRALIHVFNLLQDEYLDLFDLDLKNNPEMVFLPKDTQDLINHYLDNFHFCFLAKRIITEEMSKEARVTITENIIKNLKKL